MVPTMGTSHTGLSCNPDSPVCGLFKSLKLQCILGAISSPHQSHLLAARPWGPASDSTTWNNLLWGQGPSCSIQSRDHRKVEHLFPLVTLLCIYVASLPYPLDHFQLFTCPHPLVHLTSGWSSGPTPLLTWPLLAGHLATPLVTWPLLDDHQAPPPPCTQDHAPLFTWSPHHTDQLLCSSQRGVDFPTSGSWVKCLTSTAQDHLLLTG